MGVAVALELVTKSGTLVHLSRFTVAYTTVSWYLTDEHIGFVLGLDPPPLDC